MSSIGEKDWDTDSEKAVIGNAWLLTENTLAASKRVGYAGRGGGVVRFGGKRYLVISNRRARGEVETFAARRETRNEGEGRLQDKKSSMYLLRSENKPQNYAKIIRVVEHLKGGKKRIN